MRIGIIAWGSLYWNPGNLDMTGEWYFDGPALPIEFARISENNRLTLVIKTQFDSVKTLYCESSRLSLTDARENLRIRENTENINNIGFFDFTTNTYCVRPRNEVILETLKNWNQGKNFDAIIWSDFSPRFQNVLNKPFTIENVILFLESLKSSEKENALSYIRNTHQQISTRFREPIERHFQI